MLQQKFSTAMIEARSNMWQVEIVDPPVKATEPDFPKPVLFLAAGLMFGLAFGCGLPILIDLVADRIGSPEEIEKKLGVPVLAKLPELGVKSLPQEGWLDRLKALGFKKGDS